MVPSGIEKNEFLTQLSRLETHYKEMQALSKRKRDNLIQPALERLIQITVEDALNIGNHVISGLALPKAETYREIFLRLQEAKIISPQLSAELQTFAIFRNRLVHLYWKIGEQEFEQQLKKASVLLEFAKVVMKCLENKKLL